ncbi:SRPBCC family protein [Bacillus sp. JJ1764]|uniref:SRPBCC family protein n=1 Tax=Bacillus sp. JJ1764 TaxID=3122964 RepID=UPI002FFFD459
MEKLFVDQSVEINAPASKVWDAITKRESTDRWALEFSSGGPEFHIESDWQLGSPVYWKGQDGTVIVEGNVIALEPGQLLRFMVFDVRMKVRPKVTDEDGITFKLTEVPGKTILRILQGDFSAMENGKFYCDASAEIWDRVLPKIKAYAENN